MRNVKVAYWGACYSGYINSQFNTSMAEKSVACGAKTSIGFPKSILTTSNRAFANGFFRKLSEGWTAGEAAKYAADRLIIPFDYAKNYVLAGSPSTKLTTVTYAKRSNISTQTDYATKLSKLTSTNNYVTYKYADYTRYYYTINNVITNQFVDMPDNDFAYQHTLFQNYNISDEVSVLPITMDYNFKGLDTAETHLIYIVENNIATPVLISYVTKTQPDGSTYADAVCRNLNDGSLIDYEKISIVRG